MATAKPENELMDLLVSETSNEIAVASTGTAYGKSFILPKNCSFGLELDFSSAGAVDVKVELEEGNTPVTTEGSSDAAWFVGYTISSGVTVATPVGLAVAPVVALYGRLKFTGQGSNAASTKVVKCRLAISRNAG